ncbi:hypothetical protein Taro_024752 [Colocasia esculenta]|uniref:Uncharacterized protein n=1 Tax=Colocasia esculenta TaxID=4460 RepID=A0A843VIE5_COLES|nr:hypothetical protein [Colocasia esculenta]
MKMEIGFPHNYTFKNHLKFCVAYQCFFSKKLDVEQLFINVNQKKSDRNSSIEICAFDQERSRQDLACMIILHKYICNCGSQFSLKIFNHNFNLSLTT